MAADSECGEVGVVAARVAGNADVRTTVGKFGIADLQGATGEDGDAA